MQTPEMQKAIPKDGLSVFGSPTWWLWRQYLICGHVELRFRVVFCSVPFRYTAIPHAPVPMGSGEET